MTFAAQLTGLPLLVILPAMQEKASSTTRVLPRVWRFGSSVLLLAWAQLWY